MANQSNTEKNLLNVLNSIGLYPKTQYSISKMTVDFAFPDERAVIEIDGPEHRLNRTQKEADGNRDDYLQSIGWKVRRFSAEETYENTEKVAYKIKVFLQRIKENSLMKIQNNELNLADKPLVQDNIVPEGITEDDDILDVWKILSPSQRNLLKIGYKKGFISSEKIYELYSHKEFAVKAIKKLKSLGLIEQDLELRDNLKLTEKAKRIIYIHTV